MVLAQSLCEKLCDAANENSQRKHIGCCWGVWCNGVLPELREVAVVGQRIGEAVRGEIFGRDRQLELLAMTPRLAYSVLLGVSTRRVNRTHEQSPVREY